MRWKLIGEAIGASFSPGHIPRGRSVFDGLLPRPLLPVVETPIVGYPLRWLAQGACRGATVCANSSARAVRGLLQGLIGPGLNIDFSEDWMPRGAAGCVRDAAVRTERAHFHRRGRNHHPPVGHGSAGRHAPTLGGRPDRGRPPQAGRRSRLVPQPERHLRLRPPRPRPHRRPWFSGHQGGPDPRAACRRGADRLSRVPGPQPARLRRGRATSSVSRWAISRLADPETSADMSTKGYHLREEAFVHASSHVSPHARLVGPLVVGPGATVEDHATIVGPAAIGRGSLVAQGAVVSRSVLWGDCRLGRESLVDGCLVADGALVPPRTSRYRVLETGRLHGTRRPLSTSAPGPRPAFKHGSSRSFRCGGPDLAPSARRRAPASRAFARRSRRSRWAGVRVEAVPRAHRRSARVSGGLASLSLLLMPLGAGNVLGRLRAELVRHARHRIAVVTRFEPDRDYLAAMAALRRSRRGRALGGRIRRAPRPVRALGLALDPRRPKARRPAPGSRELARRPSGLVALFATPRLPRRSHRGDERAHPAGCLRPHLPDSALLRKRNLALCVRGGLLPHPGGGRRGPSQARGDPPGRAASLALRRGRGVDRLLPGGVAASTSGPKPASWRRTRPRSRLPWSPLLPLPRRSIPPPSSAARWSSARGWWWRAMRSSSGPASSATGAGWEAAPSSPSACSPPGRRCFRERSPDRGSSPGGRPAPSAEVGDFEPTDAGDLTVPRQLDRGAEPPRGFRPQARGGGGALAGRPAGPLPAARLPCPAREARLERPGLLQPPPGGPVRPHLPVLEVPDHASGRGRGAARAGGDQPGRWAPIQDPPRPPRNAGGPLAAAPQPRRAPAVRSTSSRAR